MSADILSLVFYLTTRSYYFTTTNFLVATESSTFNCKKYVPALKSFTLIETLPLVPVVTIIKKFCDF